jgi:hypothetical protein
MLEILSLARHLVTNKIGKCNNYYKSYVLYVIEINYYTIFIALLGFLVKFYGGWVMRVSRNISCCIC